MDDFEELLLSESDDDTKKEVKNNQFNNNINIQNNIKPPSNEIFKDLLSDESEESNKIIAINKKKKEDNKIKENLNNKKKKKKIIFNLSHSINKSNNPFFNSDIIKNNTLNPESNNNIANINNDIQNNMSHNNNGNINTLNPKNLFNPYNKINEQNNLINTLNTKNGNINENINQVNTNNQNKNKNNIKESNFNLYKSNKLDVMNNSQKININTNKKIIEESMKINSENKNQDMNDTQTNNNFNEITKEDKNINYNMTEVSYLNLKPDIEKIISLELTEIKDIKEQNSKMKFYIEELNIILKSINHKKNNNHNSLFNEEHLNKVETIANNYKEDYKNIRNRMQNVTEKDYNTLDEKESVLDDIEYYKNKIKDLKTLNRVNENIISSNEKNPKIKEMWVNTFEINFQNFKFENEKLNKIIKRNKDKFIKNKKIIEDLNKQLSDLQNNAKNNYNIDENFDKEIFGIVNKDLMIEKENVKKKLGVMLNFSDFEMKKYENYISNKEEEIEKKTIEKTKLLNLLNKEKEKTEITERDFQNYLVPLEKFNQELKRRQEIEKKKKLEEILIKRARQKLEEKEKKEKQKRDKIMLKQSMSLEKMKKKLEKNDKKRNHFNTIAYSERNNNKINNISRNNISNNHFFLTENNQIKGKEIKSKNLKLKIQIDDNNNFETIIKENKNGKRKLQSEIIPQKKISKILDKDVKVIYDKETLNEYKIKKSIDKKNKKEDDYNDENKNVSNMNTKNDESFSSNDDNYLQKLLIKNKKDEECENDEDLHENNELNSENVNISDEKKKNIINLKRDSVKKKSNINFIPNSERVSSRKIEKKKQNLKININKKQYLRHESLRTEKILTNNGINFNKYNEENETLNLVTPKFKELNDDRYDNYYNKSSKSKFQSNSIKNFEEEEYEFERKVKNNKNDNYNERINKINNSAKNSIFSINNSLKHNSLLSPINNYHVNNLTGSNRRKRSNIQIEDLKINFDNNIPNLKGKMNSNKVNNPFHHKIKRPQHHLSYIIKKNTKIKKFIDDNISDIGKNHLNSEKGRNESFFSSDEYIIRDEIIKDKKN